MESVLQLSGLLICAFMAFWWGVLPNIKHLKKKKEDE
jgi:hypothetical protein